MLYIYIYVLDKPVYFPSCNQDIYVQDKSGYSPSCNQDIQVLDKPGYSPSCNHDIKARPPPDLFAPSCLWNSTRNCLSFFTVPLIMGSMPLGDSSQYGSYGPDYLETLVSGLVPVFVVSGARSEPMFMLLFKSFLLLLDASLMFTWIKLALFLAAFHLPSHHD